MFLIIYRSYLLLERQSSTAHKTMAPQKEIPAIGITMENTRHIPAVLSTTKKDMIKTIMHIIKIVHRTVIAFFIYHHPLAFRHYFLITILHLPQASSLY